MTDIGGIYLSANISPGHIATSDRGWKLDARSQQP